MLYQLSYAHRRNAVKVSYANCCGASTLDPHLDPLSLRGRPSAFRNRPGQASHISGAALTECPHPLHPGIAVISIIFLSTTTRGIMRILVVGAGAVGGYFGARLAAAQRDVTFLVRPYRAAKIASHGLQILSPHGNL